MRGIKKGVYNRYFKRPLDFVLSLIAIVVLSPVFLVVAILVRIKLGKPVLFKQKRPGLNEKVFTIYKFRTMVDERDSEGNLLSDDARLTIFGKALRRTSLDELPELINILKGDMSFVGPRPLLLRYLPYFTERERARSKVRPGVTGLAQVSGRNAVSWRDRFAADLEYVENLSFILDLWIILRTVKAIMTPKDVLMGNENFVKDLDIERSEERAHE
ncbi:MAG TPA: sugar transferase [Kosmotogaceae bacterium]|nr:sugar transferase [Kosmotogaceae bacterium]